MTLIEGRLKYGTSKGKDTEGWGTCSLYINGHRVASCKGGGYDMRGTCFGEWIQSTYQDRLAQIRHRGVTFPSNPMADRPDRLYGLIINDDKLVIDGACGLESVFRIAKAIGIGIRQWGRSTARETVYVINDEGMNEVPSDERHI